MSFLGIAFEMSSIDAGLESGIDKATSGLDNINSMMEKQLDIVGKLKGADFSGEMEKQTKSLDKTTKAISDQGDAWGWMSEGAINFANKVDGVLTGWENGFKSSVGKSKDWWDDQWENSFTTFKKWGKNVDGVIKDVSGIYQKTLEPRLDAVKDKMGKMVDGVARFGKKGGNIIHSFGEGVGNVGNKISDVLDGMRSRIDSFNLASIASKMKDLTGETGNLSNGMESTFASMLQTTKPIVAQLNVSADRMKKINSQAAGIAYGLNTDAGAVAEMMVSMEVANKGAKEAMDEMGMSTKDWTKVIQTTDVPMSEYTAMMGDLTASWDASPKQAARMIDSLMEIGKKTGTGTLSIKSAKGYLDEIGEMFQTLPPNLARSADEIESLMLSTARFSGALVKMGETPAKAEEMARATGKMFAEQAVMVDKAFEVGGERAASNTPLIRGMMQIGMSFEQAREIVSKGSRDVAAGMQDINAAFQKYGPTASAYGMEQLQFALGEGASGLSYLANNAEIGTAALADVVNMSVTGSGALKKFGKDAFSSGLTLQDTYNRAQEAFDTTIRSIARSNVVGLVGKQMAGIKEAGKEIKALGGDKTWGPLVNAMSQYQQMGIGGIFAQMAESSGKGAKNAAKFGAKLGLVFKTMGQLGDDLAPLMQLAGMFGPGGLLVGGLGIATLFMMSPKERKEILGSYSSMFDEIGENISGIISNIDLKEMWPKVKKFGNSMLTFMQTMWGKMMDAGVIQDIGGGLKRGWEWFVTTVNWTSLVTSAGSAFLRAWNGFVDIVPWGKVVTNAQNAFDSALTWVVDNVDFTAMGQKMGDTFVALAPKVWEMLKGAWQRVGQELGVGGQLALGAIIAGKVGGGGLLGALGGGVLDLGGSMAGGFMKHMNGPMGAALVGAAIGTALWTVFKDNQDKADQTAAFSIGAEKSFTPEKLKGFSDKNLKALIKSSRAMAEMQYTTLFGWDPNAESHAATKKSQEKTLNLALAEMARRKNSQGAEGVDSIPGGIGGAALLGKESYDGAAGAGFDLAVETGKGYVLGADVAVKEIDKAQNEKIAPMIGQSLPTEGPLKDGIGAFDGGYETMLSFADGISSAAEMVRLAVEETMNDAVIFTMEEYATKMKSIVEQKNVLEGLAKQMVSNLGGKIETTVDNENDINVKKNFEAALSLPGFAGVILAVSNEGAQTRKMLAKILAENEKQTLALENKSPNSVPPTGSI